MRVALVVVLALASGAIAQEAPPRLAFLDFPLSPYRVNITEDVAVSILSGSVDVDLEFSFANVEPGPSGLPRYRFTFSRADISLRSKLRANVLSFMSEDFVLDVRALGTLVMNATQTRSPTSVLQDQLYCVAMVFEEPRFESFSLEFTALPWYVSPFRAQFEEFVEVQVKEFVKSSVNRGLLDGAKAPFSDRTCPKAPRSVLTNSRRKRAAADVNLGWLLADRNQFVFGSPFGGNVSDIALSMSIVGDGSANHFAVNASDVQMQAKGATCAVGSGSCDVRVEAPTFVAAQYEVVRINATAWNVTTPEEPFADARVTRCCVNGICGIPQCTTLAKAEAEEKFIELVGFLRGPINLELATTPPAPARGLSISGALALLIVLIIIVLAIIIIAICCCCCKKKKAPQ